MAKQKEGFRITGTIDGITYYKMGNEYYARRKGGPSRQQVMHSSSFASIRRQMSDFAKVAKANKLLRDSLRSYIFPFRSTSLVSRLTRQLNEVMNRDEFNEVGSRKLMYGDPGLLRGFDFNENTPRQRCFLVPLTTAIDRSTGRAAIEIPAFDAQVGIDALVSATHFSVHLVGLAANLDSGDAVCRETESAMFPLKGAFAPMEMEVNLSAPGNKLIILVLVLKFFSVTAAGYVSRVAAGRKDMVSILDVQ